jgi:hypothetical protein
VFDRLTKKRTHEQRGLDVDLDTLIQKGGVGRGSTIPGQDIHKRIKRAPPVKEVAPKQ